MTHLAKCTYIWIDGDKPRKLRSKERILPAIEPDAFSIDQLPEWGFDGSSTYQAIGEDSDLILKPIRAIYDPIGDEDDLLVLCEVLNPDRTPHETNKRQRLVELMAKHADQDAWIGFEQEYTLFEGVRPLGWPEGGYPAPQGPFYCGVGANEVFGRALVDEHTRACMDAGLMIFGTNAEVMPGQWEFQVGYRGLSDEIADPLTVSDHLWLARWLLYRIGEDYNINVSLHPKPIKGDWNGAGKHTNFSTKAMREPGGLDVINKAVDALGKNHDKHIAVYGVGLSERLTGRHETAHIGQFSAGVANRGCSIRIPRAVEEKGYGYLEDRRPGANADPYEVSAVLLETICG